MRGAVQGGNDPIKEEAQVKGKSGYYKIQLYTHNLTTYRSTSHNGVITLRVWWFQCALLATLHSNQLHSSQELETPLPTPICL